MLDQETKRRIDTARDILVGKVPDPKSQVEQITIALIYKFMDDMDKESVALGGNAAFFAGDYEKFSWTNIFDPKLGGFDMLNLYSNAMVELNKNPGIPQLFRDIFKNAYLPYRDPETLKMFLKIINEFHYDHSEKLGDAFEYLLSVLGSQGDAGQFRTPRHIIDFMTAIMQPQKNETICDPACGTAGFLISAYKYILKHNTHLTPDERKQLIQNFVGYDISPDMVRLSLVNLYLHGFTQPKIFEYDTLTSEDRWNEYYDIILANPPFMTPKGGIKPHKKFTMQANRSEVLFVDYIAEHIHPISGRAAIIVPEGIIFQSATAYKALRKLLFEKNLLYGVVSLPAGVFQPYSGVKTSVLLLDKTLAKKTDKILFLKIDNDGFGLGAQRKELATSDLPDIVRFINKYQSAIIGNDFSGLDLENLPPNVLLVEKNKIAENGDYNLSADRYRVDTAKKQTRFEMVRLGDIADVISGQSPESEYYNENGDGMPFYQGRTEFGETYLKEPKYWTRKITKTAIKDDILMSVRAPVGPVNISTQEICIGRGIAAIRPNEKILLTFLFTFLRFNQENIKGNGGAVFDSINRTQILDLKIPLPLLSIQKEIVAKIEQYEKIIAGAKQVTENYKPEIEINPDWEMVSLGNSDLFQIESGGTPDSTNNEYWDGNIKWTTLVDLPQADFITRIKDTKRTITELGLKNSSAKLIPANSILVSSRATIGRIAINDIELATNQGFKIIVIKNKDKVSNEFVALMITQLKYKMETLAVGGTFKEISKTNFCTLEIPLPSLTAQAEIVKRIENEQALVNANKALIALFEEKIKTEINKLWEA